MLLLQDERIHQDKPAVENRSQLPVVSKPNLCYHRILYHRDSLYANEIIIMLNFGGEKLVYEKLFLSVIFLDILEQTMGCCIIQSSLHAHSINN